jgi:hypothetical protein
MISKTETRLWIILGMLILFVSTYVGVRTTQQVGKTVKSTDLIAQCTKPGTACSKLTEDTRIVNQEFQQKTIRETVLCLGLAGKVTGTDTALFEQKFNECVIEKLPPLPPTPPPASVSPKNDAQ